MPCPGGCWPAGSQQPSAPSKEPGARARSRKQLGQGLQATPAGSGSQSEDEPGVRASDPGPTTDRCLGHMERNPGLRVLWGEARNCRTPTGLHLVGTFRKTEGRRQRRACETAGGGSSQVSLRHVHAAGSHQGWRSSRRGVGQAAPSSLLGTCPRTASLASAVQRLQEHSGPRGAPSPTSGVLKAR